MPTSPLINPEDYRLPGYTDTQTLQAAIDAVNTAGVGTIYLPRTYTITGVTIKSNVSMCGGTLVAGPNCTTMVSIANGSRNILIKDIFFDGSALADSGPLGGTCIGQTLGAQSYDVIIDGNTLKAPAVGNAYHAIIVNNLIGDIIGNIISQSGGDAININGGFVRVVANNIQNSGDGAIAVNNAGAAIVADNYVSKSVLGIGIGPNGTTSTPYTRIMVTGNFIDSCNIGINAGWFGFSGREAPRYLKVEGNRITQCKSNGMRFDGRDTSIIMDVTVTDNLITETGSNSYDGSIGTGDALVINHCRGGNISNNFITSSVGIGLTLGANLELSYSGNKIIRNNVGVSYIGTNTVLYNNNYYLSNVTDISGSANVLAGEMQFTGNLDASGNATVNHSLGVLNLGYVRSLQAYGRSASDVLLPLTIYGMDGSNVYISGGAGLASRPYLVTIDLQTKAWT